LTIATDHTRFLHWHMTTSKLKTLQRFAWNAKSDPKITAVPQVMTCSTLGEHPSVPRDVMGRGPPLLA
jgi:hypothetical protein